MLNHSRNNPFERHRRNDIYYFIATLLGIVAVASAYLCMEHNYLSFVQWMAATAVVAIAYLWYVIRLACKED